MVLLICCKSNAHKMRNGCSELRKVKGDDSPTVFFPKISSYLSQLLV